jgi:hypothetical protein
MLRNERLVRPILNLVVQKTNRVICENRWICLYVFHLDFDTTGIFRYPFALCYSTQLSTMALQR